MLPSLIPSLPFFSLLIPLSLQACGPIGQVKTTFYGWDDNDPPGAGIAGTCGRAKAGGTGSYTDPISFATATANTNIAPCGIIHIPQFRKYFRNEDECVSCSDDWKAGQYHIDFWTGSNAGPGGEGLNGCETSLDGGNMFINDAPNGLPVDLTPLYGAGGCNYQKYPIDNTANYCSGSSGPSKPGTGAGRSTTLTTRVRPAAPAPSSNEGNCGWQGHCLRAKCRTENDCDGTLICGRDGRCSAAS